jgi:hypothetical protein
VHPYVQAITTPMKIIRASFGILLVLHNDGQSNLSEGLKLLTS